MDLKDPVDYKEQIELKVYDKDLLKNDLVGEASFSLEQL